MTDRAFISIQSISKHFGEVRAVDDVNLEVAKGEFFALLGPSGCGKTTLLRMLAGFEVPTRGEIYIDGEPTAAVPHFRRPVNMVFQNYAIFPHLNVFQNIAFGLRKDRLARPDLERRVNDALSLIKLDGYGERRADELSGGQRQRVALARALIKKPKVLLLDEPLGALDKKLREQMQLELRDLQRNVGITFVFVTHDQEEALTMSDRIAVMSSGKALEHGPPSELYERPKTRFVAEFLGTMNFFEGRIAGFEGDDPVVETDRLGTVRAAGPTEFEAGDRVTVALRPENIRISRRPPEDAADTVKGTVANTAYLGDRTQLYVKIDASDQPVLVARQNMDGAEADTAAGAATVSLSWRRSSVLLLRNG
jgi:spermidine/putrescine ABC transporter ATP-binding subunit